MILPVLWFASGLVAGMYMEDIVDWLEDVVDELTPKEEAPEKRSYNPNTGWRLNVKDTEGNPVDFSMMDIEKLLHDSLKRVGLDTKIENLNKTLGQITKAVGEAFDEAGKSGTVNFTRKYTRKEEDLH